MLTDSIGTMKGVGPKTEALFHKLGIYTVDDVLHYYPRTYEQFGEPVPVCEVTEGEVVSVAGYIRKKPDINFSSPLKIITLTLVDNGASLQLTWFRMPFLKSKLVMGSYFIYRGRIVSKRGKLVMEQPRIYTPAEYEQLKCVLQPVYPLTAGITSKMIGKTVRLALDACAGMEEYLPEAMRQEYELAQCHFAYETIHFPKSREELVFARRRLVFDEFFFFIFALRHLKENTASQQNYYKIQVVDERIERFIKTLPYQLTNAQQKVWQEIKNDMGSNRVMSRLIQGDVGSGKTILAVLALLITVYNGYQGAMMAPTEVLARQHYEEIRRMLAKHDPGIQVVLLTGSMTVREKKERYQKIANKEADIIIGTHALIQEKAIYNQLALVITDEQHRFGVRQRETFSMKGAAPHVLVMSATPIPRTLAIILYGDLDISVVNELPSNRLPIKNCVVDTSYREKAYRFMEKEIAAGRQVYVICPMVEESEMLEAENVSDYAQSLKENLQSSIQIGCLHGRMKSGEKDAVMEAFADNKIQVLVSTTVVEVGVNVPNATVMMIENAERFGLAQLHQLRGRVGRGSHQSYCIFVNGSKDKGKMKRLEILNRSNDGFYIAAEDLKLRGPGDLFGIRQSGILDFKIGDIFQDAEILKKAKEAVDKCEQMFYNKSEQKQILQNLEAYIKERSGQLQL